MKRLFYMVLVMAAMTAVPAAAQTEKKTEAQKENLSLIHI